MAVVSIIQNTLKQIAKMGGFLILKQMVHAVDKLLERDKF